MPEALESLEARRAALASQAERLSRVNRASTQDMLCSVRERLAGLDTEIADRHAQTATRERRQSEETARKQERTTSEESVAAVTSITGTVAPPLPPPPSTIRDRALSAAVLPVANTDQGLARPRLKSVEERGQQPSTIVLKSASSSLTASRFSNARLSLSGASAADRARLAFLTGGASEAARPKEPPSNQPFMSTSGDVIGKSSVIDENTSASVDSRATRSVSMADIRAKAAQQLEQQQSPPLDTKEVSTRDAQGSTESSVMVGSMVDNREKGAESVERVSETSEIKTEAVNQSMKAISEEAEAPVYSSTDDGDLKPQVVPAATETDNFEAYKGHEEQNAEDEAESESDSDDDFTLGLDTAHLEFLRQQTMLHRNTETAAAEKAAAEEVPTEWPINRAISPPSSPSPPSSCASPVAVASPAQTTQQETACASSGLLSEPQSPRSPPVSASLLPLQRASMAQQQFELGFEAEDLGHLEAAATAYALCLEWDESRADAGYNLGGVLQDLGRPDEARVRYREVLTALKSSGSTDPSGLAPRAHYNMGLLLDDRGDIAAAVEAYAMAVSLRPDWLEARHNLSVAQGELLSSKDGYPAQKTTPHQHSLVLPADGHYPQNESSQWINNNADLGAAFVLPERHLSIAGNAASSNIPIPPSGKLENVMSGDAHDPESFWAYPDNGQELLVHSQSNFEPARAHDPYSRHSDESRSSADDSLSDDSSEVASTMLPEDDSSDEDGNHPHHCHHHSNHHNPSHQHHNIETLSEVASTMPPEDDSSDGKSGSSHSKYHQRHLHHQHHHHHHHHHKHGDHDDVSICTGSSDSSSSYSDDDTNDRSDFESTHSSEMSSRDSEASSTSSFGPSKTLHPASNIRHSKDSTHHKGHHQYHMSHMQKSSGAVLHHPVAVPVHEDYELDDGLTPEAAAWAAQYRRNSLQMPAATNINTVDSIHSWRVRASTGSSAEIAAAVAAAHRRASEPSSLHAMQSTSDNNDWHMPYGAQPAMIRRESKRKSKREERRRHSSSSSSIISSSSTEKSFSRRGSGDDEPLFDETRRSGETDDDFRVRRRAFVQQWRARRPAPQLARNSRQSKDMVLSAPKPPRIGGNLAKAQRLKVLRDNQRLDMLPEIIREREDQRLGVIGSASSTPSHYPSTSTSPSPRVVSPRESLLFPLGAHNAREGPLQQHEEQRRIVEKMLTGTAVIGKEEAREKEWQIESGNKNDSHERRASMKELSSSSTSLPPTPMTARLETPYYTRRQSVPKAGDPCLLM